MPVDPHAGHTHASTPAAKPAAKPASKPASKPAAKKPASKPAPTIYVCPMHPEVTSATPGTCPKCGMQLVKKEK